MTDIAFLVVNSKKERSQKLLHRLEAKVSFPVYQETEHEEVWNVLSGGKDDMFVYDRCGRLVAYIPYPLSLLDNDRSLVSNFILYAYHIDPCEEVKPCSEMEIDTELRDTGADFRNNTQEENYDQQNLPNRANEVDSESVNELWLATNETTELERNITFQTDNSSEHNSHFEIQNYTVFQGIQNSTWEIEILDQNNTTNLTITDIPNPSVGNNVSSNYTQGKFSDTEDINGLTLPDTKPTDTNPKRICVAEDEKVCKQWSKRHLKRIQRCCAYANGELKEASSRDENMCKSFQKRRCKKLRTVIKCCLKIYVPDENDEVPSSATDENKDTGEAESHDNKHMENAMHKVS